MSRAPVPSVFSSAQEPWLLEFLGTPDQAYEFSWVMSNAGLVSIVLRGLKMTSREALFSEIGAALQFPAYFGENRAALDECLTDLSWMPAPGYGLVVVDALRIVESESDDTFAMFVDALITAAREWAEPIEIGEAWDRPAVPFHVVFQVESAAREALRARFAAARATLAAWESWASTP